MNKAFADIAAAGSTVVRTWYAYCALKSCMFCVNIFCDCRGFNEVTSPNGVYYQSWSGSTPTVNTGSTGLGNFGMYSQEVLSVAIDLQSLKDNVVAAAKANGLRLIVAL
jgi:mannan endo-1,4-beta-mannosidase